MNKWAARGAKTRLHEQGEGGTVVQSGLFFRLARSAAFYKGTLMRTPVCDALKCEVPIFAFSHCRDVIVEVTKAGGFGVLGLATFPPERVEQELRWIDAHIGDKGYGVDVLIPGKYAQEAERTTGTVRGLIPEGHREF